ncbi:hypothetical protein HPB50_013318 [Hyalomma asiaticum]|uniref:Uncharacterized protein n=1 Tax=Hyalomma asiaticum TaxID=266040 RepID=A0ACB7SVC7_HYAAI|nr:hypothetical protein HPB50_013318 [Hyalomma asiaticum]
MKAIQKENTDVETQNACLMSECTLLKKQAQANELRREYSTSKTCSSNLRKHLEEFDSKKRKAEHRLTPREKRHAGGSSTQTRGSCLATLSQPKALPQSRIDRLIGNFVVAELQCFSVVENEHFRCLINAMQPSATVKNRKSLVNQIDILYREQKASLIATLVKASTVCCTAVCWTASNRSFLGVTVHFIDEQSLKRRSAAPACQRLSGRHTYDVIATALHAVLVGYKILHKICVVIRDNGSNFVKAFSVAYSEKARTVFGKLKTVWKQQSQSVQAGEAIKTALGRQLPVPNATRWNSLFAAGKFINEVMYAVAKALDILPGEQYMYMGVLQPTPHSLLQYQRSLPPLKYCTPLASALHEAVTNRLSEALEDPELALAAAVHSKFKLSWMMEERGAETLHQLEEECRALKEASSDENPATGGGSDEDDLFFQLPQASPSSTEIQQWAILPPLATPESTTRHQHPGVRLHPRDGQKFTFRQWTEQSAIESEGLA